MVLLAVWQIRLSSLAQRVQMRVEMVEWQKMEVVMVPARSIDVGAPLRLE